MSDKKQNRSRHVFLVDSCLGDRREATVLRKTHIFNLNHTVVAGLPFTERRP